MAPYTTAMPVGNTSTLPTMLSTRWRSVPSNPATRPRGAPAQRGDQHHLEPHVQVEQVAGGKRPRRPGHQPMHQRQRRRHCPPGRPLRLETRHTSAISAGTAIIPPTRRSTTNSMPKGPGPVAEDQRQPAGNSPTACSTGSATSRLASPASRLEAPSASRGRLASSSRRLPSAAPAPARGEVGHRGAHARRSASKGSGLRGASAGFGISQTIPTSPRCLASSAISSTSASTR